MATRPNPDLKLSVDNGRPTVEGECDLRSAVHLAAWLASFDEGPLEVDLAGVTFFDSSGLRAMLNARRRNPGIRIVNPSKAVLRVLEVTGTTDYLINCAGGYDE